MNEYLLVSNTVNIQGPWRYMNVTPLDLEFVHDTPIVSRPIQMSPIKDRILTSKVMDLIEHDLVKVMDHNPRYVTNISNIFLVPHNSDCKREQITGKHDPNQVQDIDSSKYRAVVDLREANATIKNPNQLNYVIESTTDLLNRMSPFSAFILIDISAAYRSFPVTEKTARRFCFRANTEYLRNKILGFASITDGISVAPSVFSHTMMTILEPIQKNCLVWIDDCLLMANSHSECLQIFQKALELLEKANVLVSLKKLVVLEEQFEYLGFQITVTPEGPKLSVPDSKREVFQRMELPTSRDGIRKILGMVTFIDLMIPGLHCHLGPLIDDLKIAIPKDKKKPLQITDIQERSFKKLTKLLDNLQDVHLFRYDQTAYLVTDASLTAAGACLFQLDKDGNRRIIAYYSKRFSTLVQCQKTSIFKEILALFFGINHFYRPYLMGAVKTVLITDLSCIITLLSCNYNPVDPVLSRLSFKLFSYGFTFQLRHAPSNKDILISDQLSRLHGEPITFTGLPLSQTKDAEDFFKNFKERIPKQWIDGAHFSYQDMINHLTSEILKDPKISENVRQKRFQNLLQNVEEKWHPPILKFVKEGRDTDILKTTVLKGDDIEVSLLECKGPYRYVDIKSAQHKKESKLAPPRSIKALNLAHIVRMQREDEQCAKVINHLLTVPVNKQDNKWKKKFKLLDSNLLVTRKNPKGLWDEKNIRIYLPITAALYVLAYMHLVSAHLGQNYLAQMFSATYRCFNLSKMVRIIVKSCTHCQVYEHKGFKYTKPGRLPRATMPSERAYMDILKIPPGKFQNKTYSYVLGILDDFSGFLNLIPLKDQTTNTVLAELGKLWASGPAPSVIITDNASNFKSLKFKEPLLNYGVKKVLTTSPNHSTSNSRIERAFKTVRRILFLNLSTFKRNSHWDVFFHSLAQFNNTPSWRLAKYSETRLPASPMELFYSRPCNTDLLDDQFGHLSNFEQSKYKDIYKKIVSDFDSEMEKQHSLEVKDMRVEKSLVPGDIVMVMNPKRIHHEVEGKGKELYLKDLWEIVEVNNAKATLSPLFHKSRKCEKIHLDHLKKYEPQMLVQLLPEEIQDLMGHYHDPELLKRSKRPPSVFERKAPLRNFPALRNRIDTDDKHSIPAIRGPLYEEDDFDDYDDPFFPPPGPDYTQIKYDKLIIPDDPNLDPHENIPDLITSRMNEQHAHNTSLRRDAGHAPLDISTPVDDPTHYEIRDDSIRHDSPNSVMKRLNLTQAKSQDKVGWSDKTHVRGYNVSDAERSFKKGQNQSTFGKIKDTMRDTMNSFLGRNDDLKSFQDVVYDNQGKSVPFQPQFESSPQKSKFNLKDGNAYNQISPVQGPAKGILKPINDMTFDKSLPLHNGSYLEDSYLNDQSFYMGNRRSPNNSFGTSGGDSTLTPNNSLNTTVYGGTPRHPRPSNSPGQRMVSPNMVTPNRHQIRGRPPPPTPEQAMRKNSPHPKGTYVTFLFVLHIWYSLCGKIYSSKSSKHTSSKEFLYYGPTKSLR